MTLFRQAVEFVLAEEGGYVADPDDPGGETNYGISRRAYPDLPIALLSREQAIAIYERDYWLPAGCDKLPPPLALCTFDAAVNMGVKTAIKQLQYAVGTVPDGIVGPRTQEAAWAGDRDGLLEKMLAKRVLAYASMHHFPKFGGGWIGRVLRMHRRALVTHWEA